MSALPGSVGFSVVGDKSVEFYRDPKKFVENKINETSSKVFQSRLLNVPTVFICSHAETRELLYEKHADFDHGYRDFLYNSYGDNILFENGDEAKNLKACMQPAFMESRYYDDIIQRICRTFLDTLSDRKTTVNVYEEFKALMTRLCLELFLGFEDSSSETADAIAGLATLHWHGIISTPVSIKIPFAGESGWRKALHAKDELLRHIRETVIKTESRSSAKQASHSSRSDGQTLVPDHHDYAKGSNVNGETVIEKLLKAPFKNASTSVEQHLLLFISALIPKAFASLITSFILELAGDEKAELRGKANSDPDFHRRALLEVQRLWPPFFGGRRIANKNTSIGKFRVPKGYAAVYVSYFAHRDSGVFCQPDSFNPDRWLEKGISSSCAGMADLRFPSVFTFGGGPRCCIGTRLIDHILTYLTKALLERYDWSVADSQDPPFMYKLLPVSRPETLPLVRFQGKTDV